MIHNLKLFSNFVEPILSGNKRFEIRENDRCFQKGDRVQFTVNTDEWAHNNKTMVSRLEHKVFEITYVISGWGLKNGFVVFGIQDESGEV